MSNRKIWSIPIAALAIMLMLAAALVTTGIVQAQAADAVTVHLTAAAVAGDDTLVATVTVKNLTLGETGDNAANDSIAYNDGAANNAAKDAIVLSGTNSEKFEVAGVDSAADPPVGGTIGSVTYPTGTTDGVSHQATQTFQIQTNGTNLAPGQVRTDGNDKD